MMLVGIPTPVLVPQTLFTPGLRQPEASPAPLRRIKPQTLKPQTSRAQHPKHFSASCCCSTIYKPKAYQNPHRRPGIPMWDLLKTCLSELLSLNPEPPNPGWAHKPQTLSQTRNPNGSFREWGTLIWYPSRIPVIRTPKKGTPNFRKLPNNPKAQLI